MEMKKHGEGGGCIAEVRVTFSSITVRTRSMIVLKIET